MPILFQYRNIRHLLGMYITKQAEQEIYLIANVMQVVANRPELSGKSRIVREIPNCPGNPELWVILICPVSASSSPILQSQPFLFVSVKREKYNS